MPWPLWSPGSIKKNAKDVCLTQQVLLGSVCVHGREQWGFTELIIQHDFCGNRRGRVLICWLRRAGLSRTKSSKVTADSLQPALTQGKKSQILTLNMVGRGCPNLTHTTCISPGHPTVDGQLARQEKGTG